MYKKIKLKVPVEAFPPNANVMGILLGHKGASHKKLEELTGCSIEIYKDNTDSQIQEVQNESFKKILPNDKIYLLVGYTDPTQLDKLEDLLYQIAGKASQLLRTTGSINLKSIFDYGMLKNNDYKMSIIPEHTFSSDNNWILYHNEKESLRQQQNLSRISESESIYHSHSTDPTDSSSSNDNLDLIKNPSSTYRQSLSMNNQLINDVPNTLTKYRFDLDEFQFIWKLHQFLNHFKSIKESEIKTKFFYFYKNDNVFIENNKNKLDNLEQMLHEYQHIFKFDPNTHCFSSNLPTNIIEDDFHEHLIEYNSNAVSLNNFYNRMNHLPNDTTPENFFKTTSSDSFYKPLTHTSNSPIPSRTNVYDEIKQNLTSTNTTNINDTFPLANSNNVKAFNNPIKNLQQSYFNNLSLTLQLIHRSLVKASQPLPIEQIENRFEFDWCRKIDLKDLNVSSIKDLFLKHEKIFHILEDPDQKMCLITPTYQPFFEPIIL